MYTTGRRR